MIPQASERRRNDRWPVKLLAKYRTSKDTLQEADAWVKDVNEDGLRLESRDQEVGVPKAGRPLTIQNFFYDDRGGREMTGTVRWIRPHTGGGWVAGVQFKGKTGTPTAFRQFLDVVRTA